MSISLKFHYFPVGTEENGQIVDEAAIFVLQLLLDVDKISLGHLSEMKTIFGPITLQIANNMFKIICDIKSVLTDECREFIKPTEIEATPKKCWGENIECELPNEPPTDTSLLQVNFICIQIFEIFLICFSGISTVSTINICS